MNNYHFTSNILQGLGKPTRRGIKKCLNCGIYNGTRRSFCKNKQCGVSLKILEDHELDFDAVRLITGTVRQVYSVRVKDTFSECRGFVQVCADLSDMALCFVDSCQSSFDNSILKCHEEGSSGTQTDVCNHINWALKSPRIAKPLPFDFQVLDRPKIPDEIKDKLRLLASNNGSPLVQRVSKNVMAVKCQVSPKQPLGYLHFTFLRGRNKGCGEYLCNCMEYLTSDPQLDSSKFKCLHFYACIVALSSDPAYLEEFSLFLSSETSLKSREGDLLAKTLQPGVVKAKRNVNPTDVRQNKITIISNRVIKKTNIIKKEITKPPPRKQKYSIKRCKRIIPKIYPIEIKVLSETCPTKNPQKDISWPFLDWLAFVTESVNKTMQFINCGIINSQVFYIPEVFYQSLKERIPAAYIEQKTNLGSVFYSIMNVNHVKEVFDTPKVKLRIAKKYVHDEQNGYVEHNETDENVEASPPYHPSFIFFLNVGQSTVDESDNCNNAFVIEWLANICSVTKVGQLKIQYKYGRKRI